MPVIKAAAAGFVSGVVLYCLFPIIVGLIGRDLVPLDHYLGVAMGLIGRGLIIKRANGGYRLVSTAYDAKYGKERATINGEKVYWADPDSLMSELAGFPFGVAHEDSGTLTTPRYAELGEYAIKKARAGEFEYEHNDGTTYICGLAPVADSDDRLVNLDMSLGIMSGNADPRTTEWAEEITKKSQNPFQSSNFVDYMGGLSAFGVTFGAAWISTELQGGPGGGGGPTVNIGMMALGALL